MKYLKWIVLGVILLATVGVYLYVVLFDLAREVDAANSEYNTSVRNLNRIGQKAVVNEKIVGAIEEHRKELKRETEECRKILRSLSLRHVPKMEQKPPPGEAVRRQDQETWVRLTKEWYTRILDAAVDRLRKGTLCKLTHPDLQSAGKGCRAAV